MIEREVITFCGSVKKNRDFFMQIQEFEAGDNLVCLVPDLSGAKKSILLLSIRHYIKILFSSRVAILVNNGHIGFHTLRELRFSLFFKKDISFIIM